MLCLNKESLQNFVLRMEQATAEANIIITILTEARGAYDREVSRNTRFCIPCCSRVLKLDSQARKELAISGYVKDRLGKLTTANAAREQNLTSFAAMGCRAPRSVIFGSFSLEGGRALTDVKSCCRIACFGGKFVDGRTRPG
jgi:hypothetical protein